MLQLVTECEIRSNHISDHSFVFIELQLEKMKHGRGLWKLNTSYLYNSHYVKQMNDEISIVEASLDTEDPSLRWEIAKNAIVEFSQWYSRKKSQQIKDKTKMLQRILQAQYKD